MAGTYDLVEGRNTISERVRRTTLQAALGAFHRGDRILELGCGTGRDAVAMARAGIRVVATDVSRGMVEATRLRAQEEGVGDLITVQNLPAATAAREDGPFDGVYSNGAVLNLEPDLSSVAAGLTESVRRGGTAVLTAANRVSLFELAVYPLALRPRKAFRKLGSTVPIPISREGIGKKYVVPTRFLTPREFCAIFAPHFDLQALRALQAITPPWNLVDFANRFRTAVLALERIEDRFGENTFLRHLGAIYLTILRRREG
ncbi:MAG TPA: class I SAM-dependent methyltransferase [Thermoplasmata archaeon]|nr:class I SAM-dependent methyltransferase [Thermoplasmata archaeon]